MTEDTWIMAPFADLVMVVVSAAGIYLAILVLTRINGLQSFSKMSGFDFAITIAIGSVIAATMVMREPPFLQGLVGLTALFVLQFLVSSIRRRVPGATRWVDNQPIVVMAGTEILSENLDRARMSKGDLFTKLRMSGVAHRNDVFAVIFETTGDVSVIKRDAPVDRALFSDVRDAERLF
jgi:uncharacterized membrane protein YcaP (DUF421 family)